MHAGAIPAAVFPRIGNNKNMEVLFMKSKKIDVLYTLLERAEREKDHEAAAALRWAIFQLENK